MFKSISKIGDIETDFLRPIYLHFWIFIEQEDTPYIPIQYAD